MSSSYVKVTREEIEQVLEGFKLVELPNTRELVYGKRVDAGSSPVTLRVYSSVENGVSRGVGEDAIRVALVTKTGDKVTGIGRSKRVNRVPGWERRLRERISKWEELLGPDCPRCGAPTKIRKGGKGEFWGCCLFPKCRGSKDILN